MSRDRLLPTSLKAEVISTLYGEADKLEWRTLGPTDRSRAYSAWVEHPHIGQVLTRYMTPEQARSWIKDGPMKEYARALRGAGRYAAFGRQGGTGAADVVHHALGESAEIVAGSLGTKPLHCAATREGATSYITWGEASNFRNLLWAALCAAVDGGFDAHIVVLEPPGTTTSSEVACRQQALAKRCGLWLHHMREVLGEPGPNQ